MDNPDPSGAVSSVIRILRKATRIVQLAPFAYLLMYAIYMLFGVFASEELLCLADSVLTISPPVTGLFLLSSRLFKLCAWHRIACLLPCTSQIEGFVDSYVITFTQTEIFAINTALGAAALLFIVLAIKHFFYGRKGTDPANA